MELFKLVGTIAIDNAKAKGALVEITNEAKKTGDALEDTGSSGEKTSGKWASAFGKMGKAAGAVGKAVAVGVGAASVAIGAIGKSAIEAYADYEQLVGGVETLFGDAAEIIHVSAGSAFQRAGMSANQYMETVTSFSASLIQSLGGDTIAAAEKADMAIVDMSDNANKMGSDITMIQNAYQGFAKQNYTMLDNLKLGYGGTKEEMERLLADAEKISGIKYDVSSYADIVDAIHVVQTEMGITGTTAKEASTTISGSLSMVKASWENVMIALTEGNEMKLEANIKNLGSSIETFAGNLMPRLQQVLSGVAQLVSQLAPTIIPMISELVVTLTPHLVQGATALVQALVSAAPSLAQGLMSALPALLMGIAQIFNQIVTELPKFIEIICAALPSLIPALVNGLVSMIVTLCTNFAQIIQPIITYLPQIIVSITQALVSNLPVLIQGLIELVFGIVRAIPQILEGLTSAAPTVIQLVVESILRCVPQLIQGLILLVVELVKALPSILSSLASALTANFVGIWNGVKNVFSDVGSWFKEKFNEGKEKAAEAWSNAKEKFAEKWRNIKDAFSKAGQWFKDTFNDAKEKAVSAWNDAKQKFSQRWEEVKTAFAESKVGKFFINTFNKAKEKAVAAWKDAKSKFSQRWEEVKSAFAEGKVGSYFKDTFTKAKDKAVSAWSNIKEKLAEPVEKAKQVISGIVDKIKGLFTNMKLKFPNIKLPHFSVKPAGWKIGDLLKGSIPKLGIEWYAKAMKTPMLMDKSTIFGYNSATGNFMGGGEAGSEMVGGTNTIMNMIKAAVAAQNDGVVYYLQRLIAILADYFPQVLASMDRDFVFNDGTMAAHLAPAMNVELGKIKSRKDRGR